jgi:hypothetical protein
LAFLSSSFFFSFFSFFFFSMMTLDSDDSDSSAGKIVHKSTSHSDDSPKGTAAAAFSFSDCKKIRGKASILILIHAQAKTFDLSTDLPSSLDSRL